MSNVPAGAQMSEDGYYWWDGSQWQPVDPPPSAGAPASSGGSAPAAADPASQTAADPSGTGWPPAGYPSDPNEWSQEQLQYWFGNLADQSEDKWLEEPSKITVNAIEGMEGQA